MIQASYGISKLSQGALQETRHNIQFSIFQFNHFKVRCSIALRKLTLLCSYQQHPSLDGAGGGGMGTQYFMNTDLPFGKPLLLSVKPFLLSLSVNLIPLATSCKCNHTVFVYLCLTSLSIMS